LEQDSVLKKLHDSEPPAGEAIWRRLPVHRYWFLLVQDVLDVYYAHPYAWDEIGFGGPAYPRGYMRLERGEPEPWEAPERRYEWEFSPSSLSGGFDPIAAPLDHEAASGHGGKR
ncbi:MAG: gluconate 2-dehydrogenase subunit 3 family protein, partial [Terriglobia bacterium]